MNARGFTLIEVLIVLGLIGLIGTASGISVHAARVRMRDAKRLSDVRVLQSALEDFFRFHNQYPDGDQVRLGDPTAASCLSEVGFVAGCQGSSRVFLQTISSEPTQGISKNVRCGSAGEAGYCYQSTENGKSYRLGFELEKGVPVANIVSGVNCLIPESGIQSGVCPQ